MTGNPTYIIALPDAGFLSRARKIINALNALIGSFCKAALKAPARPLLLAKKGRRTKKRPGASSRTSGGKARSGPQTPGNDDEPEETDNEESGDSPDSEDRDQLPNAGKSRSSEWSGRSGKDDFELIELFLNGDEEAFTSLAVKYQHKIYNLCCRIMGDRDEAQDMAQEVFITVHKSLKSFRGESLFSTWIFRVTVNHCKNRIKYLGRRRYYQTLSIDQPQELADGEVYFEPEDECPDPEEIMASREIQSLVQDAINTLDPDHRIVIVLRDIQDLSYEEIAEIVGIKVGTVKSRIHRARNDLKNKLQGRIKL
jgi:RNA polymerase sigma-70 factor (ECF subfamily)